MKRVIIIIKQRLETIPPIINLIDVLVEYNIPVTLLSIGKTREIYKNKYGNSVEFIEIKTINKKNIISKALNWYLFNNAVFNYLSNNKKLIEESILWIGSADAALALGKKLFDYNYIFQCHELYDAFPLYKKNLKKIMKNADLIINPSEERAAIFRSWYKLDNKLLTLPNKPFRHPRQKYLFIEDEKARRIIESIKNKKIVLYQGGIVAQRDVSSIAAAVEYLGNDWVLLLMGNTDSSNYLSNLLKQYPKTIHIDRIPAPSHLQITSWAHIGLVSYTFDDLNHVFCAPNKTYEYTGFGIPMLGNAIPGIKIDINKYKSGEVVDLENSTTNEIANALIKIDIEYEKYSQGALNFYESVDITKIIKDIVNL